MDTRQVTEVGRALKELGIAPIPAYSPQARGRSERNFGTWQGRLPQELRIRNIRTVTDANHFLHTHYIAELNRKFAVAAAQPGSAFVPVTHVDLNRVFSIQHERVVARDNTIQFANRVLQVPPTRFRVTLAGCRVTLYEHLDGTLSIGYGPHTVARFCANSDVATTTGSGNRSTARTPGLDVGSRPPLRPNTLRPSGFAGAPFRSRPTSKPRTKTKC